jgi:hypothetical protein
MDTDLITPSKNNRHHVGHDGGVLISGMPVAGIFHRQRTTNEDSCSCVRALNFTGQPSVKLHFRSIKPYQIFGGINL